jgi:plasmid stabilization system protein ParE
MKTFKVEFLPTAIRNLEISYQWGVSVCGKKAAQKWLRDFYSTCRARLSRIPNGCPFAPENEDIDRELRHLIIGRYRSIFFVTGDIVSIVNVRGSYTGELSNDD